jgi:Zn-dependent peptidase ImmA (M78 family)/DNA-binding XRE family transcriptional regulator
VNRIRTMRLARGLTQDALSEKMAGFVTKQALSKYETGRAAPSPSVATRLALALGVRTVELFSTPTYDIEFIAYRSNSGLGVRAQDRLQGVLAEQLGARLELQERLGADHEYRLASTPVSSVEEAEERANELRRDWGLGADPIANLTDVLERNLVHVIAVSGGPKKFHGISAIARNRDGGICGAAVAYEDGASGDRQRLTLAHELGHLAIGPAAELDEEKAAFRFGASLLVPGEELRLLLGGRRTNVGLEELLLLKKHFGVSMQALIYRARDLQIISESTMRNLFISFSRNGWRKQEPEALPLEEPTLWRQMITRALSEGVITQEEARRWGVDDSCADQTPHVLQPTALRALAKEDRARVLAAQADSARHLYTPGSELTEWAEEFVEDEVAE